jgi:hypothetical protein
MSMMVEPTRTLSCEPPFPLERESLALRTRADCINLGDELGLQFLSSGSLKSDFPFAGFDLDSTSPHRALLRTVTWAISTHGIDARLIALDGNGGCAISCRKRWCKVEAMTLETDPDAKHLIQLAQSYYQYLACEDNLNYWGERWRNYYPGGMPELWERNVYVPVIFAVPTIGYVQHVSLRQLFF